MKDLHEVIAKYEMEISQALKLDLGKCYFESYATEIGYTLNEISTAQKNLKKWMRPKFKFGSLVNFFSWSRIYPDPFGNTLIIAPWNYPFQLALSPLIGAIAAGNTAIIKASELAPHTSGIIKKIIEEKFNSDYIAVVEGDASVSQELLAQSFDYIFFTGSTQVGKIVMQAAAKNLTPVTLELGGKSPCIVDSTANLKIAAKRIVWGKFLNAGQTCVAPDYLFVHKDIKKELSENMIQEIKNFYGETISQSPDFGRIVNDKHFDRLMGLMDSSKVIFGGSSNKETKFIEPTIIDNVMPTDAIMKEEIFGPLLPIMHFSEIQEVSEYINNNHKPLAFYLFSEDAKTQRYFIRSCSFGGGCINDTIVHLADDGLPFGGVGKSGMGSYHGHYSFKTFSHYKTVLIKPTWLDLPIRYAPYGTKVNLIKKIMK